MGVKAIVMKTRQRSKPAPLGMNAAFDREMGCDKHIMTERAHEHGIHFKKKGIYCKSIKNSKAWFPLHGKCHDYNTKTKRL